MISKARPSHTTTTQLFVHPTPTTNRMECFHSQCTNFDQIYFRQTHPALHHSPFNTQRWKSIHQFVCGFRNHHHWTIWKPISCCFQIGANSSIECMRAREIEGKAVFSKVVTFWKHACNLPGMEILIFKSTPSNDAASRSRPVPCLPEMR